ncbi:MAG: hypothetical protein KDH96_09650 [Candidatus Riesia sp.]|nr:hypothetical protein [Candidatus Riesia sp.]
MESDKEKIMYDVLINNSYIKKVVYRTMNFCNNKIKEIEEKKYNNNINRDYISKIKHRAFHINLSRATLLKRLELTTRVLITNGRQYKIRQMTTPEISNSLGLLARKCYELEMEREKMSVALTTHILI